MPRPKKPTAAEVAMSLVQSLGLEGAAAAARDLVGSSTQLQLRISPARKRAYSEAARAAGQSLSRWVLEQCDRGVQRP